MSMQPLGNSLADVQAKLQSAIFPDQSSVLESHKPKGARATRRLAEWREALIRAWGRAYERARTEEEREQLDAELARLLEEGPASPRYHSNAAFKSGPQVSPDCNLAAKIMMTARVIERNSYATREKGKHGGVLGRIALKVLETLLYVVRPYHDRLCPSLDTLARLALVSRRSVVTAIGVLEHMGFLTVHRRLQHIKTRLGFAIVQDTNVYEVHLPKGFFGALIRKLFERKPECKNFPDKEIHISNPTSKASPTPPWGIPDSVFPMTG